MPRGSRRLPESCVAVLRESALVVHVGDFTAPSVLDDLAAIAPVVAVHGNMDEWPLRESLPERRVADVEGVRIGLVHDPGPAAGRHDRLRAWFPDCGIVAYGHTHAPEVVSYAGAWIVNPGSPTERRRAATHTMAIVREGAPALLELT
jgi:putative phosphoesterase